MFGPALGGLCVLTILLQPFRVTIRLRDTTGLQESKQLGIPFRKEKRKIAEMGRDKTVAKAYLGFLVITIVLLVAFRRPPGAALG